MKKAKFLLLTLLALLGVTPPIAAETVSPYSVDFNTTISISTSNRDFAIASNWGHLVDYDSNYDNHMSYSYSGTGGVDGSGALLANEQREYDYSSTGHETFDLLVTPEVSGDVTLAVKLYSTSGYVKFYEVTGSAGNFTRGNEITATGADALSTTDYNTVSITLSEGKRIGIRASRAYLDNFSATSAEIVPEKRLQIVSAEPAATTGTIYWNQLANGNVLVKYTVTVKNTSDDGVNLTQGDDDYSITIFNRTTNDKLVTVSVPQDLAQGDTSDPFAVQVEIPVDTWPNSYTYYSFDLRENLSGSTVQRAQSRYTAYESKFVFREAGTSSTSSIPAQSWGTITESTTKSYEIANTGIAPLTINSVTLPTGFTGTDVAAGTVLAGGETLSIDITNDAATKGTFSGTLTINYTNANATEATDFTLDFTAIVIGANTWTANFNNSTNTPLYPEGSIVEGGIDKDYQYISSGNYNNWLKGRNTSSYKAENNKFITPKLHAEAGDNLTFDVKAGYNSSDDYFVKVYVSTDRKNWGEPVANYVYSNTGSSFVTKSISFDTAGDYYVAFALYGNGSGIDNLVGLEKVDVAHDLYIKEVTWQDASVNSGVAQTKPVVKVIPLTNETADNYTVKYIYGENVVDIASKALTASASSTTEFAASFTPEVATTTSYTGTKVVFEFTDGTKFETDEYDFTVTNEPIFHFLSSKHSSRWYEPTSDYTTPVNFGKTNESPSKTFYILNWGSAPLQVKSIVAPTGFSANPTSLNISAFDGTSDGLETAQATVDITFDAAEAGNYSGDLVITYVDGTGADATFTLALSGTKLDPNKWYAHFNDEKFPAGSVAQSNVSTTYVTTGDNAITSSSTTNNIFVTPKLSATAGEQLLFDAKLYSSSWSEGAVKVYAAATRDEVLNTEDGTTRTELLAISGQSDDDATKITTDYKTFTVTIPAAGEYYLGFEISGRPYVDEIYGLTLADVAHDWQIASSNIPTEATQNIESTATVNIRNLGLAEEAAGSYNVTVYINGEATTTAGTVAIPTVNSLTVAGTQIPVPFRYGKVGTFPVYVEVSVDDYSVQTEAVDVTFTEETVNSDAIAVGTRKSADRNHGPIDWWNTDGDGTRWTDIVYTQEELAAYGITAGSKITSIAFKGSGTAKSIKAKVTSWVGTTTDNITPGTIDKSAFTEVSLYDNTDSPVTIDFSNTVIDLSANPIVYDGTSNIRIYTEAVGQGSGNWQTVTYEYDTDYMTSYFYSSTAVATPLGYFTLAVEPSTISGTVTDGTNAVEGATVTLVSTDGDGIEYSGTTAADGTYTINVIQTARTYDVTVSADGYDDATAEGVSFDEGSVTKNFTLTVAAPATVTITIKDGFDGTSYSGKFALDFSTVAAKAYIATAKNGDDNVSVSEVTIVPANTGVLVIGDAGTYDVPVATTETTDDFSGNLLVANVDETYTVTTSDEGYVYRYVKGSTSGTTGFQKAKSGQTVSAGKAYLRLTSASAKSFIGLDFGTATAIDSISGTRNGLNTNAPMYNLSGQRVGKDYKGVVIQNGKKFVVK